MKKTTLLWSTALVCVAVVCGTVWFALPAFAQLANGQPCTIGAECSSTLCVDGVCCNAACAGTCEACNQPGLEGTCSVVTNADDADTCTGTSTCSVVGLCLLKDAEACTADTECASNNCECTDAACVAQVCAPAPCLCGYDAGGDGCDGSLLPNTDDPEDCTGVNTCDGLGSCLLQTGQGCISDTACALGNCECADANCTVQFCAPVPCLCGYDVGFDGCDGFLVPNTDDPEDCTGVDTCDGAGSCLLKTGAVCSLDAECTSGACECADSYCALQVCSAACGTCQYTADGGLTCAANLAVGVDPRDECTGAGSPDLCDGSGGCLTLVSCPATPLSGCRTPLAGAGKTALELHYAEGSNPARNRLSYWWRFGQATTTAEYGNPVTGGTSYAICVYDEIGGVPELKSSAVVPPGGLCSGGRQGSCWWADRFGRIRFKDRDKTNDGIVAIIMRPGADGRAFIRILGVGWNVQMPAPVSSLAMLNQDTSAILQLSNSDGLCWESTFANTDNRRNTAEKYLSRRLY